MAERYMIEAQPRTVIGKQVKQLRRDGWIPAVIYGQSDPLHIQLENLQLRRVLRGAGMTHLIDVTVDGAPRTVVARDIQVHPTRGELVHIDFFEVDMRQTIKADVDVVFVGQAAPAAAGLGAVAQTLHSLNIECLPGDLISEIQVDLALIQKPDDVIHVKDVTSPPGVRILTDPDAVIASFDYISEEEEEEVTTSAEAVEVIGKGKKEEEIEA